MTGQCCAGEPTPWRRLAARFSGAAASILPGALLMFLPKCPLCLAVWLTAVTGVGVSAADASWVRWVLVLFWIAAVVLVALPNVRRRVRLINLRKARVNLLSGRTSTAS